MMTLPTSGMKLLNEKKKRWRIGGALGGDIYYSDLDLNILQVYVSLENDNNNYPPWPTSLGGNRGIM